VHINTRVFKTAKKIIKFRAFGEINQGDAFSSWTAPSLWLTNMNVKIYPVGNLNKLSLAKLINFWIVTRAEILISISMHEREDLDYFYLR
jgi:hypothetical protein